MTTPRKQDDFIRIDLTDDQREQVREKTGKTADAIELTVVELEDRIAPRLMGGAAALYQ